MRARFFAAVIIVISLASGPLMALTLNEGFSGTGPYSITDFTASVNGDYDNNGLVDGRDFLTWQRNYDADVVLPNDTTPGTVDSDDLGVWQQAYGNTRPSVVGFDEPGWNRSGTSQTGLGTFDTTNGTYDLASHNTAFILNIEALDSDVWQAIGGVNRVINPANQMELTAGFKNFVPGTAKEQRLMLQMDFGLALGIPNLLDFIDLQLAYYPDTDRYELIASPLLDGAPAVSGIVRNPRGEGLIGEDEVITSIDWQVTIASDTENGGSSIEIKFDLNSSGEWTSFFGQTISGLEYTNDLSQASSAVLVMHAYGSPGLLPSGSPDPMVTGPAVSLDYLTFTTPDEVPLAIASIPEPSTVLLALMAFGIASWRPSRTNNSIRGSMSFKTFLNPFSGSKRLRVLSL